MHANEGCSDSDLARSGLAGDLSSAMVLLFDCCKRMDGKSSLDMYSEQWVWRLDFCGPCTHEVCFLSQTTAGSQT